MSKQTDHYSALASALGLRYDKGNNVLYGQKDGYDLIIYAGDTDMPYLLSVHTAAKNAYGTSLSKEQLKDVPKRVTQLGSCTQNGNDFVVTINTGIGRRVKQEKLNSNMAGGIAGFTAYLRENGFNPCCSICGREEMVSGHQAEGAYCHLCAGCETSMRERLSTARQNQKRENVIAGIVGALLGSLLGVLCIVLLSQLGYVAALSGVIMAVGVLKGYELLGGRLTKKGIVICVLIMLGMTYFGDRLDWAILLFREGGGAEAGYTVFECYRLVPQAISTEMIDVTAYIFNLLLIYAFLLLGAVPTIRNRIKEKKKEGRMVKIGSAQ